MIDEREVFEKSFRRYEPEGGSFERLVRRRDRKRRNQRLAAGVVGIAVFVAAVWIVTSVGSLDRSEKSVVPAGTGPVQTGPVQTGPAETGSPRAPASAAPDEVLIGTCSGTARSRLELTLMEGRVKVQFEVHRSPVGHGWRIRLRHHSPTIPFPPPWPNSLVLFQGTRVASDSGVLAVQVSFPDRTGDQIGLEGYAAYAVDKQAGQVCRASAWF